MFDVGGGELLLILLAVIILFGPKKIPEIARLFGKGLRQFREAQTEIKTHIDKLQNEITGEFSEIKNEVEKTISSAHVNTENLVRQELPKTSEDTINNFENKIENEGLKENDKLQ